MFERSGVDRLLVGPPEISRAGAGWSSDGSQLAFRLPGNPAPGVSAW